jgi:YegS/Rv2252/BmrU family lipid kinase
VKTYTLVVNSNAGGGRPRKLLEGIERALRAWGVQYTVELTKGPGDATKLAAASQSDVVISVGGDGTVNEVLNGLRPGVSLGIVPAGSGNDLIKSLPIPPSPMDALHTAVYGRPLKVDAGSVTCSVHSSNEKEPGVPASSRLFLNGVGIGFDAEVAVRKGEIPYLTGTLVYVAAVLQTLGRYKSPLFKVNCNGVSRESRQLLIAVGNGRCAGGGFYLTPEADPSDGELDVCLIGHVSIFTILRLMPRVMKGRHAGHPCVTFARTREISLESLTPFFVHADGEIAGRGVNRVDIGILPQHLSVQVGY